MIDEKPLIEKLNKRIDDFVKSHPEKKGCAKAFAASCSLGPVSIIPSVLGPVLCSLEEKDDEELYKLNYDRWRASVQFSRSVMSDSLLPHGLQHTRLPCR